jgi:5-methyltetrahydrofolate corrinoid/iron sulfur protein methyltransferase
MANKFITIGERIHCISPSIKAAMEKRDPEPILKRAKEQLAAGATYLDVNIGPAEKDGVDLMKWAVKLIQDACDNVPLCLDTANKKAIEAGISVYNRAKGKPIVNSADAGDRIENIDLAAANGAICIALCAKQGIPADNDESMAYCQEMLERGMEKGMEAEDLWFDPLFVVIKGMQDKQIQTLSFIKQLSDMGFNSTGGLSNVSNMMPKDIRPIMDSVMVSMAINNGLTSAIVNPCDKRLMEAVKSADIIMNKTLYADSYLEL